MSAPAAADLAVASDLLAYLNASVTEFHAVEEARQRLLAAGFTQLSERQGWDGLQKGGRYFFTRNGSTLVAFAVGAKYEPGNGFMMVGAHTDRWEGFVKQATLQPRPRAAAGVQAARTPRRGEASSPAPAVFPPHCPSALLLPTLFCLAPPAAPASS